MIKRLRSFLRHLREPTFNDPKANRWADLFQKRARFTGQLPKPEVLKQIGIPADDPYWKQDNARPSSGFAANLGFPVAVALEADASTDLEVVAVDDFGQPIAHFPLSKTSRKIYFDSANSMFPLSGAGRTIEPKEFVWRASRAFRELLSEVESEADEPEDDEYALDNDEDDEPMSFDPGDYVISRVTWDKGVGAWYVITDQNGG